MITNILVGSWNQKLSGLQALVVQRLDNPIHRINLYPVDLLSLVHWMTIYLLANVIHPL